MSHFSGPLLNKNTAVRNRRWYNELPMDIDPDYVRFLDDFVLIGVDSATAHKWTVVKDTSAAVGIVADQLGGWLSLTSAATTENDGASIQGNEIWGVASGRDLWFETVVKPHDADDSDWAIGFTENFATNPEAMASAANRICFQVNEGDASILCKTESSSTEKSTDSGVDSADATEVTLGIHCIGTGIVEFFVNRILVATHTTNIPTANLALGAYHISGSATGTFAFQIDYILAAMTR